MTTDDISVLAYKEQAPDLRDLTVPQWLYWYRLRDVYKAYRNGIADKDRCEAEKQKWTAQYEKDRNEFVKMSDVYKSLSSFWKRIEDPSRVYANDPTIENADAFFSAVYGGVSRKLQLEQWQKGEDS